MFARLAVAALVAAAALGGEADDAVVRLMKRARPGLAAVHVLLVTRVDGPLSLVVTGADGRVGLFLQNRDHANETHQIAVSPVCPASRGWPRVERVTANEVVVSCQALQKADGAEMRTFVYDLDTRSLVRSRSNTPRSMGRLMMTGAGLRLSGALWGVRYDPATDPPFLVVPGGGASQEPRWGAMKFGAQKSFEIAVEEHRAPLIRELRSGREFPLPQSSREDVATAWPECTYRGRLQAGATVDESIGPWVLTDGLLWFGKSFFGGEGFWGVGGFGFFDPARRAYRIIAVPEVARRSATAIAVADKTVWVAFARGGSWTGDGGGVLRWDRATERTEFFPLQDRVEAMAIVGERLVMATSFGAAVLDGGNIRRFFVEWTPEHKWRVWEGAGAGSCLAERPCLESKPIVVN